MFAKRALGLAVGGLCGWTVKVAYCKESNRWGYTPPCPINPDNSIVYFDINADDKLLGRVEFEVFDDVSPLLATNFKALSYGYVLGYPIVSKHPTRGKRHGDKRLMSYHNTLFHKVVPGFIAQGGDNELYNGRGGESYSGENLKDCFRGKCGTIMEGSLCMASHARNANRSQFFIAFAPIPHLSGKNSVVGQVISGWDVIKEIETYGSVSGYPTREISVCHLSYLPDPFHVSAGKLFQTGRLDYRNYRNGPIFRRLQIFGFSSGLRVCSRDMGALLVKIKGACTTLRCPAS
eukprot:TRINITY_DN1564_c0_g1_i4.p1 TRINITY_DN1564_c0_g1~~TRINITY_DN1564_c0_g1_i4.p1  ORF type:complete len:300 (+),score=51.79 TRINITY_DN1564_c0_g1_i4:29-901(+)